MHCIGREARDGGDSVAVGTKRRDDAGMHRLAVDQHRAGAAVAGVTTFLDAEMAELAQEGAQALAGARLFREFAAVDMKAHDNPSNSPRISSASRSVMCLRHSGLPWTSSCSSASG